MAEHLGTISLAKLEELGGIVDTNAPRSRGRSAPRTWGELASTKDASRTIKVAEMQLELGGGWGALEEAIRRVAALECGNNQDLQKYYEDQLKKALYRMRKKGWHDGIYRNAAFMAEQTSIWHELKRRMLGFPSDVRDVFERLPMDTLLNFLRSNEIDGTCPKELIDFARQRGI